MAKKYIRIKIKKLGPEAGHVEIETEGFKGKGCAAAAANITKMLSKAKPLAQKHKADYYKKRDPENVKLIMQATNTLARLVRTRYNISKEDRKGLKEAIGNVLRDVALPLGIGIGTTLNK